MILSGVDLYSELIREQKRQKVLLDDVYEFINTSIERDQDVVERLKTKSEDQFTSVRIQSDDQENIFSIDTIKQICVRYRLRFLDSSLFKSEFPYDAIAEINSFEKKYDAKINSFRIMAPSKEFDLENINKDPLLFAKLSENNYFLLHQWGHDLAWHRKIISWPMQSFKTLIITISIICFLFAFSLPSSIMHILNFQSEIYLRIWLMIHTFIGMLGIALWIGISFDKTFSSMNWDSKYYNY